MPTAKKGCKEEASTVDEERRISSQEVVLKYQQQRVSHQAWPD
jgi:hypothetical protein